MQKLVKINKDKNVKISNQLYEYLNPEYTYIPIYKGYKITFNDSNNIYKEERVLETDKKIPIYSPVSGIIAGGCNKIKFNNTIVILTSNLGSADMFRESELGFTAKTAMSPFPLLMFPPCLSMLNTPAKSELISAMASSSA